ncbi:MAG: YceI family protein [Chitinophagaceae bacterium]|nr:YceI family protein [Chitinophagaceae bacterium]
MTRILYFLPFLFAITLSSISFKPAREIENEAEEVLAGKPDDSSKWVLDKSQSSITFSITHLVVSKAEGLFSIFDGTMESTRPDFSDARIRFTIDAASINTDNEARDKHLRSDGYFDVTKFPKISFEGTSFKPLGGKKYQLTGNLTLKDVTKTVVFEVVSNSNPGVKTGKASFKCTTAINRYDYHISSGGAALGKEVAIQVNVEMNELK